MTKSVLTDFVVVLELVFCSSASSLRIQNRLAKLTVVVFDEVVVVVDL